MIRTLLFNLWFVLSIAVFGQDCPMYKPLPRKSISHNWKPLFDQNLIVAKTFKLHKATYRINFIKHVQNSHQELINLDSTGIFTDDSVVKENLSKFKRLIIDNNPLLKNWDADVVLCFNTEKNAQNHIPGVISINTGLIINYDQFEELVFVICHEISHDYLFHVWKSLEKKQRILDDPQFLVLSKKLKKQRPNSKTNFEKYVLNKLGNVLEHSRENEFTADSLALILYTNCGLDRRHAFNALRKIELVPDSIIFQNRLLDSVYVNFNPGQSEESFFAGIGENEEVLFQSTHPEVKERIEHLSKLNISILDSNIRKENYQYAFFQIKKICELEYVTQGTLNGQIDLMIATSASKLDSLNNIYYYNIMMINMLNGVWAKRNHNIEKFLCTNDNTSPRYIKAIDNLFNSNNSGKLVSFLIRMNLLESLDCKDRFSQLNRTVIKILSSGLTLDETENEIKKQLSDNEYNFFLMQLF